MLLGTTDIRVDDPDDVRCEDAEVDYLLAVLREVLPGIDVGREHIRFRFMPACARCPMWTPRRRASFRAATACARSEATPERPFPVLSMVSGKWTTFRGFAEEAADAALRRLGRPRLTSTATRAIGGGADFPTDPAARAAWLRDAARETGLAEARLDALLSRYGTRALDCARAIAAGPDAPLASLPDHSDCGDRVDRPERDGRAAAGCGAAAHARRAAGAGE